MTHLDSDDSEDDDAMPDFYTEAQQQEPQFPDRPYNFATLTPTQRAHCERLLQLTQSRIDHTLTLGGTPDDPPDSDSCPEASSSSSTTTSSSNESPITTTEDATVAHFMDLLPSSTEQSMRDWLDDSSAPLYLLFGHMLRRLCGAYVELAFYDLEDDSERIRVIDCTEASTDFALECWQRGAMAGPRGLIAEMDSMGTWHAVREEIFSETGEVLSYDELFDEVVRRGREGEYDEEVMGEFGLGWEDSMDVEGG